MKTISISTDTFAAIWAARKDGEDTEDAILSRLLGGKPAEKVAAKIPTPHKQKTLKAPMQPKQSASKPAEKSGACMSTADLDLLS